MTLAPRRAPGAEEETVGVIRVMGRASIGLFAAVAAAGAVALAEGPEALNPPLKGLTERKDPAGVASVELPVNWTDVAPDPAAPDDLMHWQGFFQPPNPSGPDMHLWMVSMRGYSRARQAFWMARDSWPGAPVEGTMRTGADWIEEERLEKDTSKLRAFRVIERGGQCFELITLAYSELHPHIRNHADHVKGTFKVERPMPRPEPPAPLVASKLDTRTLWTDCKDKKLIKRAADRHAALWKQCAALFPATFLWTDPALLILCDSQAAWDVGTKAIAPIAVPSIDYRTRAVALKASHVNDAEAQRAFDVAVALQYLRHVHGGPTPLWIEAGLSMYLTHGLAAKGKPDKVDASELAQIKTSTGTRNTTITALWETPASATSAAGDSTAVLCDFWGWHLFFRHGADAAQEWAPLYAKTLEILRESGDVAAARAVWNDVDQEKLRKAHRVWISDRKQ